MMYTLVFRLFYYQNKHHVLRHIRIWDYTGIQECLKYLTFFFITERFGVQLNQFKGMF